MTAPRALLDALMEAFFDVPPRITSRGPGPGSRPVKPAAQLERHEPAPKLEAVVVPVDLAPKVERAVQVAHVAIGEPVVPVSADQQASPVQQASRGRFVPGEQQRQARGGTARSLRLSPEQRRDIASKAAAARWGRRRNPAS